jgi:DNA-binding PadR family transcriptional regulator
MNSRRRRKEKKKTRFSSEYTMLSILEYLYVNAQKTPVSKYNIVTNTARIRQQRADRINLTMDILERNEFIKSVKTSSNVTFYIITEKGIEAYSKWVKEFLNFARSTNEIKEEEEKGEDDNDI